MGLFGKNDKQRKQDAEKLQGCIEEFSDNIKAISLENRESLDKIKYDEFSDKYNEAFKNYINSKKWISHTNDVLKEISKKIKKYDGKLILEHTYKEYCDCYRYNPNKRKKDSAIDDKDVYNEYSKMLVKLGRKLKDIVKLNEDRDITTSEAM